MCENVEEIFALGEKLFVADGYHLFHVAMLSYESGSTILQGMNVWKGLCMGKMCSLIYQLSKEPMLNQQ